MEFWGVEVKSGQPFEVYLGAGKVLHLSQACLGESKNSKNESVYLHINIEGKKLVLGTLNSERLPQQLFDLVIDQDFQLSHNWKNGSVYFYGYKADQPIDESSDSEESDSDEDDVIPLPVANGRQEVKKEDKPVVVKPEEKKEDNKKVKIVEPKKDSDSDDSDSDDSESVSDDSDSDKDDEDSSDSEEDSSDEEEETPKKEQSGKKRPNESAMKTPASDKKAKLSTPQKTDGKKAGGHVATPHPSKPTKTPANTPANKSNQKTPASASTGGAHSCEPCKRTFKSDSALQSHNQAKHK